jgi:hypothetical protein
MKLVSGFLIMAKRRYFLDLHSFNLIGNPYPSAIDIDLFKGKCCFSKGNSISVVIIHLSQIKCILQLIMRFIIYWEVGTSSSKNIGINNTKPDGKLLQGSLFIVAATGGELLIIR